MSDRMFIEEKDPERRRELMKEWIRQNISWFETGDTETIDHLIRGFETIYNWYEKGWAPGGFTTAVLKNDFKQACFRADDVNRKNLHIYAMFIQWHLPSNYIDKVKDL